LTLVSVIWRTEQYTLRGRRHHIDNSGCTSYFPLRFSNNIVSYHCNEDVFGCHTWFFSPESNWKDSQEEHRMVWQIRCW